MARRLPVVIAQSPTSNPARRAVEESLVAELLTERGLDLNIVPHLEQLTVHETGLLCLEGIQGPMVLCSWLPTAEAQRVLAEKGIQGRFGRTVFDQQPVLAANGTRVIYHLELGRGEAVAVLCREVRRIRDDLATPTVAILGLDRAVPAEPAALPNAGGSRVAADMESAPAGAAGPAIDPGEVRDESAAPSPPVRTDDDAALDRLVEQLDELDL